MTASILKTLVKNHEFKSYKKLMHTWSEEEIEDVRVFIDKNLPGQ